ncbi:MAG TPA: hypothetical protein VGZ73_11765 [Bryobacteraceae bacterium]|jgi:hypothetical protein|nr:hypothetical protein [Bryobacteraceae bacterium]
MRHVIRALSMAAMASLAVAASPVQPALTIVLEFQGPHSDRSIDEMKHELETVMKGTGLTFDWRTRGQAGGESFANLVLVRFKGKCVLEPVPYLYDERGPMAFTYSTDGEVQPFSDVACDRVVAAARSAMSGGDFAHADLLLGRALGRVVAHELIHILSKSGEHGREGVAQPALSGLRLIAPELHLSNADLERIYTLP